jgi:hypothetical protein
MSKWEVAREFWMFLRAERKYWLAPLIFMLLLFGMLLLFVQNSPLAPITYPLF